MIYDEKWQEYGSFLSCLDDISSEEVSGLFLVFAHMYICMRSVLLRQMNLVYICGPAKPPVAGADGLGSMPVTRQLLSASARGWLADNLI